MRRFTPVLTLALLATLVLPAVASDGAAAPDTITLDVEQVREVVWDDHNEQLYVSTGTSDTLLVLGPDGATRAEVNGLAGAEQMDLDDTGSRLWVALSDADEVVAVDPVTRTVVDRISLPTGACPYDVVALDDRLVVAGACPAGRLWVVPLAGDRVPVLSSVLTYNPALDHVASMGDVVVLGAGDLSPVEVRTVDVSATPAVTATYRGGSYLRELAVAPDGTQVVTAAQQPIGHDALTLPGLAWERYYPTAPEPVAVRWSADGTRVAAGTNRTDVGPDVFVYGRDAAIALWKWDPPAGRQVVRRGLALDAGGARLHAVTHTAGALQPFELHIVEVGSAPSPDPSPSPSPTPPPPVATGTVAGVIRHQAGIDTPAGRVEHGVAKLLDAATGRVLRTVSATSDGRYRFTKVAPGDYKLVFSNSATGQHLDYFAEAYREQPVLQLRRAAVVRVRSGQTTTADGNLAPLFDDMSGSRFFDSIGFLRDTGTTRGCNPGAGNTLYCPEATVTRGQMAAFLVRFLGLGPADASVDFRDIDNSPFREDIRRLASAGITRGCNPSDGNTLFCPDTPVTRGQMAAFLVRAFRIPQGESDLFRDMGGSPFRHDADRLASALITRSCNPPDNDRFCPGDPVSRGQMAAFLHRAHKWDMNR